MAKTISLKASDLEAGETASMRTIEWTDAEGAAQSAKILATGDIEIPALPDPEEGILVIVSVKQFRVDGSKLELVLGTANSITGVAGDDITKEITLDLVDLVSAVSYDVTAKKFVQSKKSATVFTAGAATDSDVVSLVSHASQHVEE